MRPIMLRFAGLHSYRAPQEVDFTDLCAGGLFGIFGPTGSGKSTVLDAITLALYARVDRAGGTRQGILNHNEESLFVDFTFELGSDADCRRYQVERRYRRSGPHSVNVTHARLVAHIGGTPTVLADKDGDVTAEIEKILGLKHEDFTRAVVLPQGKFAEFLGMKGSDRRQMLERLFALEEYGQRLMRRIAERRDKVVNQLHHVTGEQTGLGDASQERVEELRTAVKEAAEQMTAAREHLDTIRNEYVAAEKRRSLQSELTAVQKSLEPLYAAQDDVASVAEELRLAEAAEPIRRDLEAVAESEHRLKAASERVVRAEQALQQALVADAEAAMAHDTARQARQAQEPALLSKRTQLEQGISEEERLRSLEQQIAELQTARRKHDTQLQTVSLDETQAIAQVRADEAELGRKHDEDRRLAVSPERRRTIARAITALDRLESAQKTLGQRTEELHGAQRALHLALESFKQAEHIAQHEQTKTQELEERLRQLESAPPTDDNTLAANVAFLERVRGQIEQIASYEADLKDANQALEDAQLRHAGAEQQSLAASQTVAKAASYRDALRLELEQARIEEHKVDLANRAAILAADLVAGQPCSVCGSSHHPTPAAHANDADQARELVVRIQERLNAAEREFITAEQKQAVLEVQRQHAQTVLTERAQTAENAQARLDDNRAKLPAAWRDLPLTHVRELLAAEEATHAAQQATAQTWHDQVASLRNQLESQRRTVDTVSRALAKASTDRAGKEATYASHAKAVSDAQDHVNAASEAFQAAADTREASAIRGEFQEIEAADDRSATLRTEIVQLEERISTQRRQLEALHAQRSAIEAKLNELDTELRHLGQQRDQMVAALKALTGGRPVRIVLDEVTSLLTQLTTAEDATAKRQDDARKERSRCEQEVAIADEGVKNSEEAATTARLRLANALRLASFASSDDVAAALRSDDTRDAMLQHIQQHARALDRLHQQQDRLRDQLQGEWLDDDAWASIQEALQMAEAARETAIDAHGAVHKAFQDIVSRHEQWKCLEKTRIAAQDLKDRLDQLTVLFRGNRFVEFVSEEYLTAVALAASGHLGDLTRHRYGLEIDSGSGFVVRDDSNGGVKRPVSSLSGGETFITSLALALALSNQIQLHGTYPLEFFFLDEGFGTLDPELLETVITSLERLQSDRVNIGIISHVPELRQRMSRRLIVEPADDNGSRLRFERG